MHEWPMKTSNDITGAPDGDRPIGGHGDDAHRVGPTAPLKSSTEASSTDKPLGEVPAR